MVVTPINEIELRDAVQAVAARAAELVRSVQDMDIPTRGLRWTVGETAAHIIAVLNEHTEFLAGVSKPPDIAEIPANNERLINQIQERSAPGLADLLTEAAQGFARSIAARPGSEPFQWFGGHAVDLNTATCVVLGELIVHGYDIARTINRPWRIDPRHAVLVLSGFTSVLPFYVNPQTAARLSATYEIRLRRGPRFVASFNNGVLTLEPGGSHRVDCCISADPVAFMLVGYGRISQWGPILRGKMTSWGRKPWLGFKFSSLLLKP